jgi:hypothetical protein
LAAGRVACARLTRLQADLERPEPLLKVVLYYNQLNMRCEVDNGVVTFLTHADVRPVSEAQVARSPHLARLRLLPGVAELPIRPDAFLAWQDLVEEVCGVEDLSLETACELFEARFLQLGMCGDNSIAVILAECVQAPDSRTACVMHLWEVDACA